ncbi:MAG: alpha/beta fold hydrolase [Candidatus Rokubacteria bacterium]|nr:alpha/beta fold hydrolase [Candidatus Rokubacteria bacterium]
MATLERRGQPTLHYEIDDFTDPWRDAPFLILQHGYGRSGRFWYGWVPYLSRFYRVVRPDLRGLGQSDVPADLDRDVTVERYIEDLVAIIDALGGGPVHYCGESLGGILGMVLAATHPDELRTLSLVAAPVLINTDTQKTFAFGHPSWQDALRAMGSRGWAEAANSATRFPAGTDPALQRWYADEMGRSRVEVLIRMSRIASSVDATPYLARIRTPVLGLYPAQAPVTIQTQEQALRQAIKDLTIVHVPSRFHTIQNLMPAALARQVLYFAAQHDGVACDEP